MSPGNLAHVEDGNASGVDKRVDLTAIDGVLGVIPAISVQNLSGLRQFLDVLRCGQPVPCGSPGARFEPLEERELWPQA
ncbi:hypothetical protein ABZ672_04345 [Streptomyces mirabilis]